MNTLGTWQQRSTGRFVVNYARTIDHMYWWRAEPASGEPVEGYSDWYCLGRWRALMSLYYASLGTMRVERAAGRYWPWRWCWEITGKARYSSFLRTIVHPAEDGFSLFAFTSRWRARKALRRLERARLQAQEREIAEVVEQTMARGAAGE